MQVAWGKWHSLLRFSCLQENCVSWKKKAPLMWVCHGSLGVGLAWWLQSGRMSVCLYFHNSFLKQSGFFLPVSFIIPPTSLLVWHSYHLNNWGKPSSTLTGVFLWASCRRKSCSHEGSAPLWRCWNTDPLPLPRCSGWIWGEMSVFKLQPCFWCPLLALNIWEFWWSLSSFIFSYNEPENL